MSYDIDLTIDTGFTSPWPVVEFNITYNVADMVRFAAEHSEFNLGWFNFRDLHGHPAGQVGSWCEFILRELEDPANYAELKRLEPTNSWGTLEQLIAFMHSLRDACRQHFKTRIDVY